MHKSWTSVFPWVERPPGTKILLDAPNLNIHLAFPKQPGSTLHTAAPLLFLNAVPAPN